jgi:hypothetical protein
MSTSAAVLTQAQADLVRRLGLDGCGEIGRLKDVLAEIKRGVGALERSLARAVDRQRVGTGQHPARSRWPAAGAISGMVIQRRMTF